MSGGIKSTCIIVREAGIFSYGTYIGEGQGILTRNPFRILSLAHVPPEGTIIIVTCKTYQ